MTNLDRTKQRIRDDALKIIAEAPAGGSGESSYTSGIIQSIANELVEYRERDKNKQLVFFELVTDDGRTRPIPNGKIATTIESVAQQWHDENAFHSYRKRSYDLVFDVDEISKIREEHERKAALEKLTAREKQLLGITKE